MTAFFAAVLILLPMIGAYPAAVLSKKIKRGFLPVILICAVEFAVAAASVFAGNGSLFLSAFGIEGMHLAIDGFSGIYVSVTCFMWLIAAGFSPMYFQKEKASGKYIFFYLLTLGATTGLFLSKDLLTAFLFFEILSLASYPWVVEEGTKEAFSAGKTYLTVAVIGGMVLFMGLVMTSSLLGTLEFDKLSEAATRCTRKTELSVAGLCMLFGFGAKAGMYPLHIWLPKAHPVAPSPASALLSGILTKAGIFGIIVLCMKIFKGEEAFGNVILLLGGITMLWGAFLALSSTNLKKTLACSSVSQIGFILVGLGSAQILARFSEEEAATVATGCFLHMINHSLLKLLLFLLAGVVVAKTGKLEFDSIKGFGRKHPLFGAAFLIGCLGLGCIPGFNGYISKTLLHEGPVLLAEFTGNGIYTLLEWLFLLSGGFTICYMAKLFTVLFIDKKISSPAFHEAPLHLGFGAVASLSASAVAVLLSGIPAICRLLAEKGLIFFSFSSGLAKETASQLTYTKLYTPAHLKGSVISLFFGVLLFVAIVLGVMRRKKGYQKLLPSVFDLEKQIYSPFGSALLFLLQVFFMIFELTDALILLCSHWFNPSRKEKAGKRVKFERFIGKFAERSLHLQDGYGKVQRARFTFANTLSMVSRSFAFTMAMTCVGLCLLLVYMILF